eukprot:jgi/Chlat1/592/Chrsp103S01027
MEAAAHGAMAARAAAAAAGAAGRSASMAAARCSPAAVARARAMAWSVTGVRLAAVARPAARLANAGRRRWQQRGAAGPASPRRTAVVAARKDDADDEARGFDLEGPVLSGEWPESFSMLNYEDVVAHYEPKMFKPDAQPNVLVGRVMSSEVTTASKTTLVSDIKHYFDTMTGLPVVDESGMVVGVISRKDTNKGGAAVGDVMSYPPITITPEKTVAEAAALMLKNKVHRIPVVDEDGKIMGIVTRTDIFTALMPTDAEAVPTRA